MPSVSRDADRRGLEHEIRKHAYQELLQQLQQRDQRFRGFADWRELVGFMQNGQLRDLSKDTILLPIIQAHVVDRDARWRTILLAIFWRALESILRKKRHWDNDPDQLWGNTYWSFMQAICRLDPAQRPSRLAQKLSNDTIHRLHRLYRRNWDHARRQISTDSDDMATKYATKTERSAAAIELGEEQELRITQFQAYRRSGQIDDVEFLLLVGKHVYGHSIATDAGAAGLTYEAAKKRQQRAIKAIGGIPAS
jgi:hypothetical protein